MLIIVVLFFCCLASLLAKLLVAMKERYVQANNPLPSWDGKAMPIGDVSFSRHGGRFDIFGRFRDNGVVKGNAHEQTSDCDSGKMTWRAERVD